MKLSKSLSLGIASLALSSSTFAGGLFSEGFENLATSGWILTNNSTPAGQSWFQGVGDIFAAQAGSANSYAAANFLSAAGGTGTLSNWLISPEILLGAGPTRLNFFARGDLADGFFDQIGVFFSAGSSSNTAAFSRLDTIVAPTGGWQEFSFNLPTATTGRIAFVYSGNAADANYAGIDSVSVIPEPASLALAGVALAGLALTRRRQAQA